MSKIILTILLLSFIIPISAQTRAEKKKIKQEKEAEQYADLKSFINENKIHFEADWATANSGRRISLIGNSNFLKIDDKKGDIYLPFFGTAHSSSVGFGGNSGIEFKGTIEKYSVKFNDKKQLVTIKFRVKEKSEYFDFTLTMYGNKNADLSVSSNSRSNMSYSGNYKGIPPSN